MMPGTPDDDDRENAPIPTAENPLVFETDINQEGAFHPEWLVVDDANAYVFSRNGGNRAKLRHVRAARNHSGGQNRNPRRQRQINVRTDDETISLLRFSQADIGEANIVARQLDALAKGEPPRQEKAEETRKHCPNCKRVLPEDSEVCPACINKRAVMLRLFQFLAPYKKQVAFSIFLLFGTTAVDLTPPYIAGRIIDTLNNQVARQDVRHAAPARLCRPARYRPHSRCRLHVWAAPPEPLARRAHHDGHPHGAVRQVQAVAVWATTTSAARAA